MEVVETKSVLVERLQLLAILFFCLFSACSAVKDKSMYHNYKNDQVRQPPNIQPTDLEEHILFEDDQLLELPCYATGTPTPRYEWIRNGKLVDPNGYNINMGDPASGQLTIRATLLDEGFYQCRAINIHGTSVTREYFLQRAYLGTYEHTEVRNYTVTEGMWLNMTCLPIKSNPKPRYNWQVTKTTISKDPTPYHPTERTIKDEDGNMYFSYVTRGDALLTNDDSEHPSRLYKCSVFNSQIDFSTGGSYSRIIVEPATNRDSLADKPPTLLYKTASPHMVLKGNVLRIQCIFAGRPQVKVTWDPIQLGSDISLLEFDTVLEIRNVQYSHERSYKCRGRNSAGENEADIQVDVQSVPEFEVYPNNTNATEKDTVSIDCRTVDNAEPPAVISWYINGKPIDPKNPAPRTELADNGKRLTISNLCKDCPGNGLSDIRVVQCNASNVHGYVFADAYLNVLLETAILTPPVNLDLSINDKFAVFHCDALSDASTPVTVSWKLNSKPLKWYDDKRLRLNGSSLVVDLEGLDYSDKRIYEGQYACLVTNNYSSRQAQANLTIDDGIIRPLAWWILLIFALLGLLLLILLLILCCCCCYKRNRGGVYPVDEKERFMGNDPEKECDTCGFHDYIRPEADLLKGSRASLASTIQLDLDEEGSLAEYGLVDTTRRK